VGVGGLVATLIFILSFILLIAAAASGYESLDLLPTSIGVLYALIGAVAACGAVVTFAIGVLTWRIGELAKLVRQSAGPLALPTALEAATSAKTASTETVSVPPSVIETELPASMGEAEDESPINFNRSGHLPSLEAIETVLETPEEPQGPPTLIGSYSSAGANYKIFSDGSIEAETGEGTFRFASMSDFKRHLSETKAKTASASE
jgi:hypothetical protein